MKIQSISICRLPITNYHAAYGIISTLVESALQIHPFLTNKANFQKSQINVNNVLTREYEQMDTWSNGKNKAKTKPIQTQFKANTNPIQTQYKPNTKPIQTQYKPNFNRPTYTAGNCFEYSMRTGKDKKTCRYIQVKEKHIFVYVYGFCRNFITFYGLFGGKK